MIKTFKDYKKIVGSEVINEIKTKAKRFRKKRIVCINSTFQGGGVAEMLNSIVILFNEIGIDFGWRILQGTPDFFSITKKFHNALQGDDIKLSEREKQLYFETNERFSKFTHLTHDLVIIHDPQPTALINFYKKKQPWILRYHLDLSNPNPLAWNYLKQFIKKYDHFIVSTEEYKKNLPITQSIIWPAIDPLTPKNKLTQKRIINKYLKRHGLDIRKPIISQISRFDKWKDPEGVVKIFDLVKKKINCQLILLGNTAPDDPEGVEIYNRLIKKFGNRDDIKILVNVENNDLVVNALQTESAVIIQKSLREGFGLTVSEALYKNTPVVASRIGGIPLQIVNGKNGFLHEPTDYKSFAESIVKILKNKKLRNEQGKNAREYVTNNFLITRLILDWLNLFEKHLT